jgi:hypothetical protein
VFGAPRYRIAFALLLALTLASSLLAGCNDLRDFRGTWQGSLMSNEAVLRQGMADNAVANLEIIALDRHGLRARLDIGGVAYGEIVSVPGAEADVLATMTFNNAPLRVYLCFAPMQSGDAAVVLISLFDDSRIELRVIRGGSPATSIYAVFGLRPSGNAP